jgi:hypothetical protein
LIDRNKKQIERILFYCCDGFLKIATCFLVAFDCFEQCLEIANAKTLNEPNLATQTLVGIDLRYDYDVE